MSTSVSSLLLRSARIAAAIKAEERRRRPSWLRLLRLKQLRLALAWRLHAFAGGLAAQGAPQPLPVRARSAARR
ncbi:MAG: hypothetical protein M5U07_24475 [Xanthobacteraceae bacterium]|nr:hypothetical protein [Xanthobacteraceae bacterium]